MKTKLLLLFAIFSGSTFAQSWNALGMGLNGFVSDMCADSVTNTIYVLGNFSSASGVNSHGLAKWNGTAWANIPMDTIINSWGGGASTCDIEFYKGKLYLTGTAAPCDKTAPSNQWLLWEWSGAHWTRTNSNLLKIDTSAFCGPGSTGNEGSFAAQLKVINGKLFGLTRNYASMTGGAPFQRGVFSWDGTIAQWETTDLNLYDNYPTSISYNIYNNNIYVNCSYQFSASLTYSDTLYKFSGTWSIPSNTIGFPYSFNGNKIEPFNSDLLVMGSGEILSYNYTTGVNTSAPSMGPLYDIYYNANNLYVGGNFTTINGFAWSSPGIAKFDGTNYYQIGSGFDNQVNKLITCNGKLYAGGSFLYAGTTAVNNIAVYDLVNGIEQNYSNNNIVIYPNPSSDHFFVDVNTSDKINVDLYDINGRHVFSARVGNKSNIDVATLDNGTYTVTVKTADRVINKKLVILR